VKQEPLLYPGSRTAAGGREGNQKRTSDSPRRHPPGQFYKRRRGDDKFIPVSGEPVESNRTRRNNKIQKYISQRKKGSEDDD